MNRWTTRCIPLFTVLIAAVLLLAACADKSTEAPAREITVFAAASLTESFTQAARVFESSHPGVKVRVSFAASTALMAQIDNGAPADVFATARAKDLVRGYEAGWMKQGAARVFAGNSVVLLLNKRDLPEVHTIADLLQPGVRLVGCQPEVPVAYYIRNMLERAEALGELEPGMTARIQGAFVSRELSVKAISHKVELGAGNAGFVYGTDAHVALARNPDLMILPLPESWRVEVAYGITPLKGSRDYDLAEAFVDMITHEPGAALLTHYGFTPRDEPFDPDSPIILAMP